MRPTTTAPLHAQAADLSAATSEPDPLDLIAVSIIHLALWRAAVAVDRYGPGS